MHAYEHPMTYAWLFKKRYFIYRPIDVHTFRGIITKLGYELEHFF